MVMCAELSHRLFLYNNNLQSLVVVECCCNDVLALFLVIYDS